MANKLKGKKVLVTAGSTWVAIDSVRVVTNIFGGALGVSVAKKCAEEGAETTLLIGPGRTEIPQYNQAIRVEKFKYFSELSDLVNKELSHNKYDAVIHSAAVSDYEPIDKIEGKVKSGKEKITIELKPTHKIVDSMKKIDPDIFLVKFKLEVGVSKDALIESAKNGLKKSKADLIVANEFTEIAGNHRAYIIDTEGNISSFEGKEEIAKALVDKISDSIT